MVGRTSHRGRRIAAPESTRKRESDIFRPRSTSADPQSTASPPEADILFRSASHWTQFSRGSARAAAQGGSTSRYLPWSKPVDHLKNTPEQISWHGDLRHLECHVAPVDNKLCADLHELFPQTALPPINRYLKLNWPPIRGAYSEPKRSLN